jgi:crotonobetainyl-CoA:carnitine CoA-transferase CaiB-like acyl-CoA transferase
MPERIRVIDVSQGWAGPMVGFILSCFGAEVIKVESARYYDWWRGSPHPDAKPGEQRHERSAPHNTVNRNKRGVTIDLSMPEGRRAR